MQVGDGVGVGLLLDPPDPFDGLELGDDFALVDPPDFGLLDAVAPAELPDVLVPPFGVAVFVPPDFVPPVFVLPDFAVPDFAVPVVVP